MTFNRLFQERASTWSITNLGGYIAQAGDNFGFDTAFTRTLDIPAGYFITLDNTDASAAFPGTNYKIAGTITISDVYAISYRPTRTDIDVNRAFPIGKQTTSIALALSVSSVNSNSGSANLPREGAKVRWGYVTETEWTVSGTSLSTLNTVNRSSDMLFYNNNNQLIYNIPANFFTTNVGATDGVDLVSALMPSPITVVKDANNPGRTFFDRILEADYEIFFDPFGGTVAYTRVYTDNKVIPPLLRDPRLP